MTEITYNDPPLLCVVVSIQFEKVANFSEHLSTLLKLFPEIGFPIPDSVKMNAIKFGPVGDAGPRVSWFETTKWDFKDQARTTLIRLDDDGVAIHFADYRTFDTKNKILQNILQVINEALPSVIVKEYVLRYINHIPIQENENLTEWVNPAILGLPDQPDLELESLGSVTESIFQSGPDGRLLVRCSTMAGGLTLPPDLFPLDLNLSISLESNCPFIRLENVHLLQVTESFQSTLALERISSLRASISLLFTALTTPTAHKKWHKQ
jgi:uncharacterized protein (TIGR04255 family)